MVSITAKRAMVGCFKTIELANNEGKLQSAMSKSKETERWHHQTEKKRLFKVTETQLRQQIHMATYICNTFLRYQIKENKKAEIRTERSQVFKER